MTLSMPDPLLEILSIAYVKGITLQCNFYRINSHQVARAASLGLISTILPNLQFGGTWRPTVDGLIYLFNLQETTDYAEYNNLETNPMDTKASHPPLDTFLDGFNTGWSSQTMRKT